MTITTDDHHRRLGAVWLLDRHHQLSHEILLPLCQSLVNSDPHPSVRSGAISQIGRMLAGAYDATVSNWLAQIALTKTETATLRVAAYLALKRIHSDQEIADTQAFIDHIAETLSLIRHPKLDPDQIKWASEFL